MPKFKCEKCKTLFAGWGPGVICPLCGGKLGAISWEKYYEERHKIMERKELRNVSNSDL